MTTLRYGDVVTSTEISPSLEEKLKKRRSESDTLDSDSELVQQPDSKTNEPKRSK